MSKFSNANSLVTPPKLAQKILSWLVPARLLDNLIGDLEEEFYLIAEQDINKANKWFWRQTFDTSYLYLGKKFSSVEVLGRLNFYLPLALFLVVAVLISLLSNISDPELISPTFWDELLQGKIHTAILSESFWHNFWNILRMSDLGMFVSEGAFLVATINTSILIYLYKKQKATALKLLVWGYTLAFIPYIWGLLHIASHDFVAKQIGPIIALGIISMLYTILPTTYLIHRKVKHQQAELKAFEQHKLQQDRELD